MTYWHALLLAIVEGITEFLPVSSTGHMIIASALLGIPPTPFFKLYLVVIQLGAILSVLVVYWKRFFQKHRLLFEAAGGVSAHRAGGAAAQKAHRCAARIGDDGGRDAGARRRGAAVRRPLVSAGRAQGGRAPRHQSQLQGSVDNRPVSVPGRGAGHQPLGGHHHRRPHPEADAPGGGRVRLFPGHAHDGGGGGEGHLRLLQGSQSQRG